MKEALGDKVTDVRLSTQLKSHAACISTDGMISTGDGEGLKRHARPGEEQGSRPSGCWN